ncbi:MAG: fibronectin type III domain-containing protein [Vicinamibacterales bacterium]
MARLVSTLCAVFCLASGVAQAATLRLAWDRNPETDVTGYRVRYGTSSRSYTVTIDVGNRTDFAVPNLAQGVRYYIAVQAYNRAGVSSALSAEVNGVAVLDGSATAANILLGQGRFADQGGYFAVHGGQEFSFGSNAFARVPWPVYNATGGGVHLATGDVDGDGLDEVVVGLGRRSNGFVAVLDDAAHGYTLLRWIQVDWRAYTSSNGEVYPAVGNLDGDAREEIVLGLGDGGRGWYQIFDDASQNYRHLSWEQVNWPAYNAGHGPTHPAIGDFDGDGSSEIVLGLGRGAGGWLEIVNGASSGFSHRGWIRIDWDAYASANGATYPAAGDIDADGRAEIVIGLGSGSGGSFEVLDDADASFAHLRWERASWTAYNSFSGETHPAVGNVDGDAAAEIVLGLGEFLGNGGWFEIRDDRAHGYASLGWRNIGWPSFTASGGALYPAISKR